jgi:hypothetical protein
VDPGAALPIGERGVYDGIDRCGPQPNGHGTQAVPNLRRTEVQPRPHLVTLRNLVLVMVGAPNVTNGRLTSSNARWGPS